MLSLRPECLESVCVQSPIEGLGVDPGDGAVGEADQGRGPGGGA